MNITVRTVDANLLIALHALLEERNLTHAGARLHMSQPAMSGALTRLRAHFDDPLLVRSGRDFQLTELAERLRPVVAEAVQSAQALLGEARAFEPDKATRCFTVSLSEYAMTVLARPLIRALQEQAPGCSVSFDTLPAARADFESYLTRRDLVIGPLGFDFPGDRQPIFTDELVCLVARDHPRLVDGALTLDDLREMPHAVAEFAAAGPVKRPLEVLAERYGLAERTVQVTVTSLLTLPYAITGTELCAFVPYRLARRCMDILDLAVAQTPVPAVQITEAAHWHPRRVDDPAGRWLRALLHSVAVGLEDAG
ncbi:LysR family transcriptional regulator [Phytohabitans rumicis]|uniref:LysR family transcriptional regulator n=1 Tax=Phytohabitans rumicis TaxID=1076125 RepID=A0A6V8KSK2_9ACTN|nr:LysR family transcriptional regulator [Phytohabitans rumicis]GFJ86400.1 LysR family transcriptional regulator [Phytohabitans rumicis]